jgi:hypothetical protein
MMLTHAIRATCRDDALSGCGRWQHPSLKQKLDRGRRRDHRSGLEVVHHRRRKTHFSSLRAALLCSTPIHGIPIVGQLEIRLDAVSPWTAPALEAGLVEDRQGQKRERGENAINRGLRKYKLATLGVPAPTTVGVEILQVATRSGVEEEYVSSIR